VNWTSDNAIDFAANRQAGGFFQGDGSRSRRRGCRLA
jgi:hypothetical protein